MVASNKEAAKRSCHHVIGLVPIQAAEKLSGYGNIVHIDELRRLSTYGGVTFDFCPMCGSRLYFHFGDSAPREK